MRQDGDVGVRDRLHTLGLTLPAVPKMPPGVVTTFSWVRVHGDRVMVSGDLHLTQHNLDARWESPMSSFPVEIPTPLLSSNSAMRYPMLVTWRARRGGAGLCFKGGGGGL